jgi:c-di-GMP-binding flagellar brake protein YcgR
MPAQLASRSCMPRRVQRIDLDAREAVPNLMLRRVSDRRRYPRVKAEVLCRPAGSSLFHHRRSTQDISLGGMRVFSDEDFPVGGQLDLDVLLPDGASVRCWAEVVWRVELDVSAAAKFDIGLRFTDLAPADVQRLAAVLGPAS